MEINKVISLSVFSLLFASCGGNTGSPGDISPAAKNVGSSVNGSWTIQQRFCSDGSPVNDRFKMGRDSMKLTILGSEGSSNVTIEGETFSSNFKVDQQAQTISPSNSANATDVANYTLNSAGALLLTYGGFGDGGSCHTGTTLTSVFTEQK